MRSNLPSAKRMPPARSVKPVVLLPCHALDLTVEAPPHAVTPIMLVHHMPALGTDALHLHITRGQLWIDVKYRQRNRVRARGAASQRHGVARARETHRHRPPVEAPVVVLAVPGVVAVAVLRRVRLLRAAGDLLAVVQVLRKILILIIANHYGPVLLPVAGVRELPVRECLVERIVHVPAAAARFRNGTRAQLHPLPGAADGLRSETAPDDSALAGVHALPRAIRRAAAGARSRGAAGSRVGARDDTRRANRGNARGANRRGRRRATRGNARGANRRGRRRATRGNARGANRLGRR